MCMCWTVTDGVDTQDAILHQTGVVQLYHVTNGQVDVTQPLMTLTGDQELARFGANVLVSILHVIQPQFEL